MSWRVLSCFPGKFILILLGQGAVQGAAAVKKAAVVLKFEENVRFLTQVKLLMCGWVPLNLSWRHHTSVLVLEKKGVWG